MSKKLITSERMTEIPLMFNLDDYIRMCCHGCEWLNPDTEADKICKKPKNYKCDNKMISFS